MRPSHFSVLPLLAGVSEAFSNTSPFFAFSDRALAQDASSKNFARSSQLEENIASAWTQCDPEALFVVVSQPGVTAADFQSKATTPYLRRALGSASDAQTKIAVPDVVGALDANGVADSIAKKCGIPKKAIDAAGAVEVASGSSQVLTVELPAVSQDAAARESQLAEHDSVLNAILAHSRSHTVFYLTTPPSTGSASTKTRSHLLSHHKHGAHKSPSVGEAASTRVHVDLKRDEQQPDTAKPTNDGALFERYNFLNQGIFMGGLVVILLLSILYVGLTAVASVEITPFAFSKEMGPQNQRKQG